MVNRRQNEAPAACPLIVEYYMRSYGKRPYYGKNRTARHWLFYYIRDNSVDSGHSTDSRTLGCSEVTCIFCIKGMKSICENCIKECCIKENCIKTYRKTYNVLCNM